DKTTDAPTTTVEIPAAPGAPTLTAGSDTAISLSWTAVTGATSYEVWRHTGNDNSVATKLGGSTAITVTTFADSGLAAATRYYYWLKACLNDACSDFSSPANTFTLSTSPGGGAALTLVVNSANQITITWLSSMAMADVPTIYEVYRTPSGGGETKIRSEIKTRDTNTLTYVDTGLSGGTTYTYRVRACVGSVCSESISTATTLPIPAAPGALELTVDSSSQITLTWSISPTAGVDSYVVFRSSGGGNLSKVHTKTGTAATFMPLSGRTYVDTGLSGDTAYTYNVVACVGSVCSGSIPTTVTTPPAPSAPGVTVAITIVAAPSSLIPPSNFVAAATQGSPAIAPRSWTGFADDGGQARDQEGQDQGRANREASPPADADGDGLIDIATTEQLNNMRYNLAGTSLKTSQSDPGNNAGCPSTGCFGYELINDINFDLDGDGRTWTGNVVDGYTLDADDTTSLFPTNVTDSAAPAG
ncbi:MAG: fibronectin type III domain-containing protein, partial [Proteobacteria bacterium]|nr:fibronectin type III domain-containing protein [Pseudomonadota bacterium]